MKTTINLKFLVISLIASLAFLTSCKKEKIQELNADSIVGTWSMTDGYARIYQEAEFLGKLDMPTTGTMTFDENGTGKININVNIEEESIDMNESINWRREGKTLMVSGNEAEEKWILVEDGETNKTIEFTFQDEEMEAEEVRIEMVFSMRK